MDKEDQQRIEGRIFLDGLFLQFTEPIVHDLYIPDEYNIEKLLMIASDVLKGQKIKPRDINCMSYHDENIQIKIFPDLKDRLTEGIYSAFFRERRNEPTIAEHYVSNSQIFGREHHVGYGTMFRFRDGETERARNRVEAFYDAEELSDLDRLGVIIRPFVGKTNSPAKIQ